MALAPGTKCGPYEILAPLGAGGMGEVYRARDPRLQRDVAIKVLPAALRSEPERLARFEREARVLASLNHPRIGALLGLEDADGVPALILELIEGPTLAQHLTLKGALPPVEAIEVARAIAEAMEYAHERGIVHRDLKPANVKFTADGALKVLDFGLAKALLGDEGSASDPMLTHSPTITVGTQAGVILGTAAYMAPEQARGRSVDRRADIWAFGVMLFEMLTGRALFAGETVSDTIARILEREPDWAQLPAATPDRLRELLRRCLAKDPRERLRDIGDARLELEAAGRDLASGIRPAAQSARSASPASRVAIAVAIVAAFFAGALTGRLMQSPKSGVVRLSVVPPADLAVRNLWVSPDGMTMLARGDSKLAPDGRARERHLYIRRLDRFDWVPVPGTDGLDSYDVSRDGHSVYFVAPLAPGSPLKQMSRVALDGGSPPVALLPWSETWTSWESLPSGGFAVVTGTDSLGLIAPGGSEPTEWHRVQFESTLPQLQLDETLPNGSACLCTIGYFAANGWTYAATALDLKTGQMHVIARNAASPRRTPQGRILFTRGATVLATRFDARTFEPVGEPVAVFEGVRLSNVWEHGTINTSASGTLTYAPGSAQDRQRWVAVIGADGRAIEWNSERGGYESSPTIAPDGRTLVVTNVPSGSATFELLLLTRGQAGARRLAGVPGEDCSHPLYSPDGKRIVYQRQGKDETAGIYLCEVDHAGDAKRIFPAKDGTNAFDAPASWSSDGQWLYVDSREDHRYRIRRILLSEPTPVVQEVLRAPYDAGSARVSPDGKLLAFLQNESGIPELSIGEIRSDGQLTGTVQVSRGGASQVRWVPGTRTILYSTPARLVMQSQIGSGLEFSPPAFRTTIVDVVNSEADFSVAPDGSIVVVHRAKDEEDASQFNLVLGFDREVERALDRDSKH